MFPASNSGVRRGRGIRRNIEYQLHCPSGHGPQNPDGSVAGPFGKVGTNDVSVEQEYESAKLAGLSILGSLKRELGRLDKVAAWLQVRVMINTVDGLPTQLMWLMAFLI
jgi:hypothetical protein